MQFSVFYLFVLPFPPSLIWRKICNKDAEGLLQAIAFKFKFSRAIDSMSLARSSNTPLTAIVHFRDLAVTFRPRKLCRAESHRPILDSNDRVEWLWPTSKYRCEYQWSPYLFPSPFFFLSFFFFFHSTIRDFIFFHDYTEISLSFRLRDKMITRRIDFITGKNKFIGDLTI